MKKTFAMALEVPSNRRFTAGRWYEVIDWWGDDGDPVVQNDKGMFCPIFWHKCDYLDGGDWLRYDGDEAPPDGWKPGDPDFRQPALDLSNPLSQTFDALPTEVQDGLRALPRDDVEVKDLLSGVWVPRLSTSFFRGGVYRKKPGPVVIYHQTLPPGEYIGPDGTKIIITKETDQ